MATAYFVNPAKKKTEASFDTIEQARESVALILDHFHSWAPETWGPTVAAWASGAGSVTGPDGFVYGVDRD